MYEFCLYEWHKDPFEIINTWTDELLSLMTLKLIQRHRKMRRPPPSSENGNADAKTVSLEELAGMTPHIKYEKVDKLCP